MSLLLESDIAERLPREMRGHVVRIGGSMDQLVPYDRLTDVTEINFPTAASAATCARSYRKPTQFEHATDDFGRKTSHEDVTHLLDYVESAVVKHGWQREFHRRYPVTSARLRRRHHERTV